MDWWAAGGMSCTLALPDSEGLSPSSTPEYDKLRSAVPWLRPAATKVIILDCFPAAVTDTMADAASEVTGKSKLTATPDQPSATRSRRSYLAMITQPLRRLPTLHEGYWRS
jgi:hypothetical protein